MWSYIPYMTPIFKSDYSIGKSILTIENIVKLYKKTNEKFLVLVEDSMTVFVKGHNLTKQNDIHLVFGLRVSCCNDVSKENDNSDHKVIILAKNDQGCKLLNKIYSFAHIGNKGQVDFNYLNTIWDNDSLQLVIPFYDSFIYQNQLYLKNCIPNFNKIKPIFWIEKNNLPFDDIISQAVFEYCKDKYDSELVKSVLYEKKDDAEALQTYKIICGRKFGRPSTLSCPNLNHFGSNEFCFESFEEYVNG